MQAGRAQIRIAALMSMGVFALVLPGGGAGAPSSAPSPFTAYVATSGTNTVTPIALTTGTPGTSIPVGRQPLGVAITPDGKTAYVTNAFSRSVTPIALATDTPRHADLPRHATS